MYTAEHIAALIEVITEQRSRIAELTAKVDEASKEAERNWEWYREEKAKHSELAEKLNQPRI